MAWQDLIDAKIRGFESGAKYASLKMLRGRNIQQNFEPQIKGRFKRICDCSVGHDRKVENQLYILSPVEFEIRLRKELAGLMVTVPRTIA